MKEATRSELWPVLREAFESIKLSIQHSVPCVKMQAAHSHNDAFFFRSYAQYSDAGRVVDVSFDVQMAGKQVHVWGDIAEESGLVLKDLTDTMIDDGADVDKRVIGIAMRFAADCKRHLRIIETALK